LSAFKVQCIEVNKLDIFMVEILAKSIKNNYLLQSQVN